METFAKVPFFLQYVTILVLLGFALPSGHAQEAGITGVVLDSQGLAVPGASITVLNESTSVRRVTTSTDTGSYNVRALDPGSYIIRVQKDGFETTERAGISIFVATVSRIDLHLAVGHKEESIRVSSDASLLQTETAQLSTSVTREQYDNLPLIQQGRIREPFTFMTLAPGVQGFFGAATTLLTVNGSAFITTEFQLSGMSVGDMQPAAVGTYSQSTPPVDAMQEFKAITTMLPADYGHTGTATGIFAIRNGTNDWHGSIYEYFQNNALNAQPYGGAYGLYLRQNEFGATTGGPVMLPKYNGRNRSFFFFSYGGSRKTGADSSSTAIIPTPQQISGNFMGQRIIYDPATTRLGPDGVHYIRDPFPNNMIPTKRINPIAAKVVSYYPAPNAPGSGRYQGYVGDGLLNEDVYTTRVDHHFSDSQHLYGTFVRTRIPRIQVFTALPGILGTRATPYITWDATAHINYDWTISSNMLNSLVIGYYRELVNVQPGNTGAFSVPNQISDSLPAISFSNGYTSLVGNFTHKNAEQQFKGKDTFYWSHGAHNIRFGAEFRRVHFNNISPNPGSSSLSFSNLETADPNNPSTTGDPIASMLLGQVDNGGLTAAAVIATRYTYAGAFIQDDWKMNRKLTLNLGARWEIQTIPIEAEDKSSIISLTTPNPGAGNLAGALIYAGSGAGRSGNRALAPNRYIGFSPRLGVAYQVTPKIVTRAGFGLFYSDDSNNINNYGFAKSATYTTNNNGVTPAFDLSAGYPGSPSLQPTISATLLNGQSGNYLTPRAGYMPYTEQWTAGVEYSPSSNWLLEAVYVGSTSHRLLNPNFENVNQVDPKYLSLGSLLTVPASSAAAKGAGVSLPYAGFTGTVAQALRPYPQYQTLTDAAGNAGYSNFNAGEVVVQKRMSYGLQVNANYTYAKWLGINNSQFNTSTLVVQNVYNPSAEYSINTRDLRHAVVVNYSYNLPFGRGKRFMSSGALADAFFGGWSIAGVQRYQSGAPLAISTSNSLPIFNRVLRPNVVPGVSRSTHLSTSQIVPGVSRLINPAAFAQPAPFTFGNAKPTYSDLRSNPYYDEDFTVGKVTRISEHLTWNLYANFVNAFNRHYFTVSDTILTDANFGIASVASTPRHIQIATRFQF